MVGTRGLYRSFKCPTWVSTVQQAELYALYSAAKIGAYILQNLGVRAGGILLGTDSEVSRY